LVSFTILFAFSEGLSRQRLTGLNSLATCWLNNAVDVVDERIT
jgi:hypothetical protein